MFTPFHKSTITLLCCIAFIIGIGVGTVQAFPFEWVIILLIVSCVGIIITFHVYVRMCCVAILFCVLGIGRTFLLPTFESNEYEQHIDCMGEIVREPELLTDKQKLIIRCEGVKGLIQVKALLQPKYSYGDEIQLQCMLRKPEAFETFRYDKYLERYHVSSICTAPFITTIGSKPSFQRALFSCKRFLVERLQHALSSPEHTLLLGVIFGINNAMPAPIADAFRTSGTTHLLVISGYNVALLATFLLNIMRYVPLSRRAAIGVVIGMLALYAVFTGSQPPAVRAAIFSSAVLFAQLLGRKGQALRMLVFVATGMLIINPLLLLFDGGFQLSFLATAGIIVFNPYLEKKLYFIPETLALRSATATTLSAMIPTTSLIAYSFHSFSIIALAANLVVGPLVTIVMFGGLVVVMISSVLPYWIASWLLLPLYYFIHLTITIVQWFSSLPYASLTLPSFHWSLFAMASLIIMLFGARILRQKA
ncbi:MAG TPA: ComEC/Rec2 family competence protein [Patescibacteria group bacterium]|nr:ComEC/Rec2 family competence protein [Patescibacteria group bacterium]